MKEYVGIYIKTEKSTGTRWLWQQNEIPLPHNFIFNKIYREKSIPMSALWCPAFSNHG